MNKIYLILVVFSMMACQRVKEEPLRSAELIDLVRYQGAQVFNGTAFVPKELCVTNKRFVDCARASDQSSAVNMAGLYVTPPFGDAHTHHYDGQFTLDWHNSIAMQSGAFYAMTMTAPTTGVVAIREKLASQGYVDVASSLGGITGPNSHPTEIYEALALNIRNPEERTKRLKEVMASQRYADNAYYVVEDAASVQDKMALLLSQKPDHIKVFLRGSNRYGGNRDKLLADGGVDPKLLPLISKMTKDAGLRLAVANSNVADFRESLKVGAAIVTHLPCYQDTEADPNSDYFKVLAEADCLLSADDAQAAADIGMAATLISTEWEKDRPERLVDWERHNVKLLKESGTKLVVATNNYGSTLTKGLIAAVDKGFFDAAELLKMATIDTPQFIFPKRRIGCLDVGCEASFIGFADNPLGDFKVIADIRYRLKEGSQIELDQPSE